MKIKFKLNVKILLSFILFLSFVTFFSACKKDGQTDLNKTGDNLDKPVFVGNIPGTSYVANQVLVKFKKDANPEVVGLVYGKINATIEERILTAAMIEAGDMDGIVLINVVGDIFEAISKLKNMPEVEYAEPNYIYTHHATSNDPYYTGTIGNLWGMYGDASSPANTFGSQAAEAWANGKTGSSDVIVAVIDEGIMNTHEDLAANCWVNPYDAMGDHKDNDKNGYVDDKWGWDFEGNNNKTFDDANDDHATHVAGTIGAIGGNSKGVAGMNWNIKMISCKFLGTNGGTLANAIKALDYVTDLKTRHGMNIVATNNSWGGGGYSTGLFDAINRAGAKDILFIAAAGNGGTDNDATPSYPASYSSSNIIAVAAITSSGDLATWSQYGANSVDIGAPGSEIYSSIPVATTVKKKTTITSGYANYSGTSMATPHVTGAAALYASTHAGSSAAAIKAAILNSAISTGSLSGKCVTGGRLDVSGF